MLKIFFLELPNTTNVPFWKRSSCILGRSGLFVKGIESVLEYCFPNIPNMANGFSIYLELVKNIGSQRLESKWKDNRLFKKHSTYSEGFRRVLEKNQVFIQL